MAINPNTVLKAYRELETEGWSAAGPGVGTFVAKTLSDASVAAHGPLREDLKRWLARARQAGLDEESIEALIWDTFRSVRAGRSMTAVLEAAGSASASDGARPSATARSDSAGKGRRPRRPQRCRQDDAAAAGRRHSDPDVGQITCSGQPAVNAAQLGRVGFVAQDTPTYAGFTVADYLRLGARLNPAWDNGLRSAGLRRSAWIPARAATCREVSGHSSR